MTDGEKGGIAVLPIEYHTPDHIHGRYATNLVVQRSDQEFILSFFEVQPPIVLAETPEERQQQLEKIESVKAVCVARIIVSTDRMPGFVDAMQRNLDRHKAGVGEEDLEE